MSQMSFSDFEYAGKRKQTRRERFLAEMDLKYGELNLTATVAQHIRSARSGRVLEVMQSLKAKGLHYDAVDNLYCRGTKLSSRPLFYQRIYSAYINGLDSALPVTKV
jgi:hypothetical protein